MARPKFVIDYKAVEKLASLMCTQEEIANYLGCSVDTLQRDKEFCGLYKKGMDNGKMSLRRLQYQSAQDGNVTMQIWLGKQWLGQRENLDIVKTDMSRVDTLLQEIEKSAKK
jgi:hypothetical protein